MSNALVIIFGIGAIQCILFALLILLKKQRKSSDWVLFSWFIIFFVHLVLGIGKKTNPTQSIEICIMTIGFLHGPLFLFYAKTIFTIPIKKVEVLHLFPFAFFTILSFFIKEEKEQLWEIVILIVKLISLIFYPIYILYVHHKKITLLKTNIADNSIWEFSWIRIIAFIFLVSTGVSMIRLATELIVGVAYFEFLDGLRYVILIIVIGFYGLKYGMVYKPEGHLNMIAHDKKYKHSPLKNGEINTFTNTINRFFQDNDAYLLPDFSLTTLSESVQIPKHHLSQIINSEMHTTFYDLVNSKRVAYAVQRIQEGTNLTLEGLGYECGFNSKSAFFSNFKKNIGKTPGQFKKEISTD